MTPMSYLELLGSFKRQLNQKRAEVGRNRSRLQVCSRRLVLDFLPYSMCFTGFRAVVRTRNVRSLLEIWGNSSVLATCALSGKLKCRMKNYRRLTLAPSLSLSVSLFLSLPGGARQAEQHQGRGGDSARGTDRLAAAARQNHERGALGPRRYARHTCFFNFELE